MNKVIMCFDDAENCTFQPNVKESSVASRKYDFWTRFTRNEESGINRWVNKMGKNFLNRYPKIYRFGLLKRSTGLIEKGDYTKAYGDLLEQFDIEGVKKFFEGDKYKGPLKKESMFYHEKLGKTEDDLKKMA